MAGVYTALADQVRLTRLQCERIRPDSMICNSIERTGMGILGTESLREVTVEQQDSVTLEQSQGRHGTFSTLAITRPDGKTRTVATILHGNLEPMRRALAAYLQNVDSPRLKVEATSWLPALFLGFVALLALLGAVFFGVGYVAPVVATSGPPELAGKGALDVAARLAADLTNPAWDAQVSRRMHAVLATAGEEEEALFHRQLAERQRAARAYFRAICKGLSDADARDCWQRAQALDGATTRVVQKELGYPGTDRDDPPDPRLICPGFTDETYVHVRGRILQDLR